jgi:hypothetical protein
MVGAGAPRVVVVVRDGCHLCEDAVAAVAAVCEPLAVGWSARDLATVKEPQRGQWTDLIPVVLVDDDVHDVLHVDSDRLRELLR